jgi:hypothetical protein
MGRKYIKQVNNQNFIYPNNDLSEYDIELVQDINDYSVSGSVISLSATTQTFSGITFSLNYTWSKNGAEPFINQVGEIPIVSIHMMGPTQLYYKPWRLVEYIVASSTGATSQSGTTSFTVTPSQLGLTTFTTGSYNFEIRFIGHRAVYPVCQSVAVTVTPPPTPTPTPTPTPPPPTPTFTPTPTPTPPPSYTTGATLNVTDTGWIKYNMSTGTTYQFIGSTGSVVLTNCLDCATIVPGIPFADVAVFTITNCGNPCSPPPTPTPTPTSTGATSYTIELRMNGMVERNGRFTLYQSPDNGVYTEAVVLNTVGSETAVQSFNGTPGYYYYYTVENTSGPFCVANAYNTVLATDFSPGPIQNAWCDSSHVTTDWFQLPDPLQVRSYISFNGTLDSGCL